MTTHRYATALAFKTALEQRLRTASRDGSDLARRRQLLVFERLLARITRLMGPAVMLKGGLALELRLTRARTTRDVDLRFTGSADRLLAHLEDTNELAMNDFLRFDLRPDRAHPAIRGEGVRYEGLRFRARCTLADKEYGSPFSVDVGFADPILGEPDELLGSDLLAFAGIDPVRLRVYPIETHIAEKLHAHTLPRVGVNSRVKDLPDLALLASIGDRRAERVRAALQQTFVFRATHPLPVALPDPPEAWTLPYARIAEENSLPWPTLAAVTAAARGFLHPVLAGHDGRWSPEQWAWLPA